MSRLFEIKPRWPNAPLICKYENLPAFNSVDILLRYHEQNCPAAKITEKWLCEACKSYHFIAIPPQPAGTTSGTAREFIPRTPRYKREAYGSA